MHTLPLHVQQKEFRPSSPMPRPESRLVVVDPDADLWKAVNEGVVKSGDLSPSLRLRVSKASSMSTLFGRQDAPWSNRPPIPPPVQPPTSPPAPTIEIQLLKRELEAEEARRCRAEVRAQKLKQILRTLVDVVF